MNWYVFLICSRAAVCGRLDQRVDGVDELVARLPQPHHGIETHVDVEVVDEVAQGEHRIGRIRLRCHERAAEFTGDARPGGPVLRPPFPDLSPSIAKRGARVAVEVVRALPHEGSRRSERGVILRLQQVTELLLGGSTPQLDAPAGEHPLLVAGAWVRPDCGQGAPPGELVRRGLVARPDLAQRPEDAARDLVRCACRLPDEERRHGRAGSPIRPTA